jgi:hypothetical protein
VADLGSANADRAATRIALEATAATGIIGREEVGCLLHWLACRMGQLDLLVSFVGEDGAGAPGGPPKAEPGAGSAGRGAA